MSNPKPAQKEEQKIPMETPAPKPPPPNMAAPKTRQIVIETDGKNINLKVAEVSHLEMKAIFISLLEMMNTQKQ